MTESAGKTILNNCYKQIDVDRQVPNGSYSEIIYVQKKDEKDENKYVCKVANKATGVTGDTIEKRLENEINLLNKFKKDEKDKHIWSIEADGYWQYSEDTADEAAHEKRPI